jgi:hypothetical protein
MYTRIYARSVFIARAASPPAPPRWVRSEVDRSVARTETRRRAPRKHGARHSDRRAEAATRSRHRASGRDARRGRGRRRVVRRAGQRGSRSAGRRWRIPHRRGRRTATTRAASPGRASRHGSATEKSRAPNVAASASARCGWSRAWGADHYRRPRPACHARQLCAHCARRVDGESAPSRSVRRLRPRTGRPRPARATVRLDVSGRGAGWAAELPE